jgi:hypothetical protein
MDLPHKSLNVIDVWSESLQFPSDAIKTDDIPIEIGGTNTLFET